MGISMKYEKNIGFYDYIPLFLIIATNKHIINIFHQEFYSLTTEQIQRVSPSPFPSEIMSYLLYSHNLRESL